MRTAFLFPGQGSQTSDMRDTVARLRPDLYELALDEVGNELFERADEKTEFAQPAIYCASLAGWSDYEGERPYAMAGHSLGEFAALAAAGAIDEATGLRLVALRGRLMQRMAERGPEGGMLALRTHLDEAGELAGRFDLTVANDNSPEQVVLSGPTDALDRAAEQAGAEGTRARRLAVAGAFHTPAMDPAAAKFRAALERIAFKRPQVPVFSGVTAALFDDFRRRLAQAIIRPVQWRETLLSLDRWGVERFVEVGPGKVLSGLVRKTLDDAQAETLDRGAPSPLRTPPETGALAPLPR
jgi:[acyl-carrier-protein] S-malonyltransferase